MLFRALTYCLLMMMLLQSVIAVADMHAAHQSGVEHRDFENHQHHDDVLSESSSIDSASQLLTSDGPDCHHCCHCHGHFSPAILLNAERSLLAPVSSGFPRYTVVSPSENLETFLRPPIA